MMNQARSPTLPSFSGLSSAVKEAREYENTRRTPGRSTRTEVQDNNNSSSSTSTSVLSRRTRQPSVSSPVSETSADGFERSAPPKAVGGSLGKAPFAHGNSSTLLLQDTLSPLLEEVDALFAKGQEISASLKTQGNRMQEDDVEVEIMERMADEWQAIEARNARHDTSHKLHREKPMFCMDSLGKRIKAALLCKILPKDDNPAEYVNGASNAPSRNLVTAIKLAGYVVHSGTGGKVSPVDGDGREPPSKYTKEEFHNNVLPRAADNQPPRILNELRQLSCRLVASGIAKGLLKEEDLPEIRKTLVNRFQDGGMHFLAGGDAAFARFIGVAANAHRMLERGDIDDFVLFHERVVKLVGMCRNRVRRAAYATSKNMLAQADGSRRYMVVKPNSTRRGQAQPPQQQHQQQQQHQSPAEAVAAAAAAAASAAAAAAAATTPVSVTSAQSMPWRNGEAGAPSVAAPTSVHGRGGVPPQLPGPGQSPYDTLTAAGAPYGKSPIENGASGGGGGGFGGTSGFNNGGAIVRAAMSVLPMDSMAVPGATDRAQPISFAPGAEASNGSAAPFHDHNALSAAAPEILTQMGYRRAPAFGPDGAWGAGAPRGQPAAPVARLDSPPVLVLQPGWGVTLPPYFLGMMDAKRPRSVPVKMLWELRAEPLPGSPDGVVVEMRQVPGYLDFLAEIMPPDMLKFRWSMRCWETLQGKHDARPLLEEAAAAVHHLGLVPMPPDSPLRLIYEELVSHGGRNGESMPPPHGGGVLGATIPPSGNNPDTSRPHSAGHNDGLLHAASSLGVPPVAAGVLRDLHREGTLNGEALNVYADGGVASAEMQRALAAPAPGPDPTALSLPTGPPVSVDGMAGAGGGAGGVTSGAPPAGVSAGVPGGWAPPAPAGTPTPSGNNNGKRKAGAAFPDAAAAPEADADW